MKRPKSKKAIYQESPWAKKGFAYYCTLGARRNFDLVAERFEVSKATVQLWAHRFEWLDRVTDYDAKLFNALSEDAKIAIEDLKDEILNILRHMYREVVTFNPDGSIKKLKLKQIRTIADFEKLTKLYLLIAGEPTEREHSDVYIHDLREVSEETLRNIAGNISAPSGMRAGTA